MLWAHHYEVHEVGPEDVTKLNYLACWKEDSEGDITVIKGDRGIRGTLGATGSRGEVGPEGGIGHHGAKGDKVDAGPTGAKGRKGDPGYGYFEFLYHLL